MGLRRLAEREGFEPSVSVSQYTGLANQRLKPLGHRSPWPATRFEARFLDERGLETARKMAACRGKVNPTAKPEKPRAFRDLNNFFDRFACRPPGMEHSFPAVWLSRQLIADELSTDGGVVETEPAVAVEKVDIAGCRDASQET